MYSYLFIYLFIYLNAYHLDWNVIVPMYITNTKYNILLYIIY